MSSVTHRRDKRELFTVIVMAVSAVVKVAGAFQCRLKFLPCKKNRPHELKIQVQKYFAATKLSGWQKQLLTGKFLILRCRKGN